ncbi:hypothetical protein RI103_34205 [Paraburkholderia sp. FT54]|uniref:hypothetical protein n=1 Tax=Paraburkholderia sp. FT54 TaxID=3074437 RepID=UPI0028780522|nr:hypothetical protein [Paraburkholderia sp. FT54]WNC94944.1 hypothetical protein RI103_34205 [Paraburkholderia sp. FT54]
MNKQKLLEDVPPRGFHLRVAFKGTGRQFSHGFVLGIIGIAVRMIEGTLHLNALWIGARGAAWRENVSWSWSSRHWRFKSNWLFRVGFYEQ